MGSLQKSEAQKEGQRIMENREIIDRCYGNLEAYDKLDGCYDVVLSTC